MKIIYKLFVGAVTAVKALNFNFYNKKEIATPLAKGGSHIRRYTISDCSSHIVSSSGSYRKRNIALISLNPNYEPMYFNQEEIEEKPVKIIGKVVELRRKF